MDLSPHGMGTFINDSRMDGKKTDADAGRHTSCTKQPPGEPVVSFHFPPSAEKVRLFLLVYNRLTCGAVAELADAGDLKSPGVAPLVGSTPTRPTN
jgi:hypothetical protein